MRRLLCYAHFDGNGQVQPFVKHALHAMEPECATTVFVSNSGVAEHDRTDLLTICSDVVINESNSGYDFYMWKLALEKADISSYDEVILMNSSVYGPVSDIGAVFACMADVECDFWGITECTQIEPHVQSYFLVFRRRVIESHAFRDFWNGVLGYVNKAQLIRCYEVGLTQWLRESGFKLGVYCSFERLGNYCRTVGRRLRRKDNTSVDHALELLKIGNPFLKREAVRDQKVDMPQTLQLLQQHNYPSDLIHELTSKIPEQCPVCGAASTGYRKRVRDFAWLHDDDRYSYRKCKSSSCGIVWLDAAKTVPRAPVVYPPLAPTLVPASGALPDTRIPPTTGDVLVLLSENHGAEGQSTGSAQEAPAGASIYYGVLDDHGVPQLPPDIHMDPVLFDAILVNGGIERSGSPLETLGALNRLLKPGGSLQLRTPNINSFFSLVARQYWFGLNAPRNKTLFSRRALKHALTKSGYVDVAVTADTTHTYEYAWHSFNIWRNKWTSPSMMVLVGRRSRSIVNRCAGIANFLLRGGGEELTATARKRE